MFIFSSVQLVGPVHVSSPASGALPPLVFLVEITWALLSTFSYNFGHLYVLFGNISIWFLYLCFNWVICFCFCFFLLLSCMNYSYILDINSFSDIWLANILCYYVGCLFIDLLFYCAVDTTQSHIEIQCNLYQNFSDIFHRNRKILKKTLELLEKLLKCVWNHKEYLNR